MVGTQRESGLSEVIGFILIIAILVVVASLYVTYVVPAHGREAEIEHMTYIKNQFVDFKMAMDSLWINSQVNTSLSQNIEMGTLGQKTEGQFVFLPLTQPIGSDGEMRLSTDKKDGTIQISMTGLLNRTEEFTPGGKDQSLTAKGSADQIFVNPDFYKQMLIYQSKYPADVKNMIKIPNNLPVFSTIPVDPNDFNSNQLLEFHLIDIVPSSSTTTPKWVASFNLTRVPGFYVQNTSVSNNASKFYPSDNWAGYMRANYRYDLVMNLIKRNMTTGNLYPVFTNLTIMSYSQKPSADILLNLQDPAYGLDTSGPISVKDSEGNTFDAVYNISRNTDINITHALNMTEITNAIKSSYEISSLTTSNSSMGKFTYTGKNYYWVAQEFYYQMGGVFLVQNLSEGSVTKVLPLITLGVAENKTPSISITRLIFDGQNASISGSTSVQVVSRVSEIRKGIISDEFGDQYYIAPTQENARYVKIVIGPGNMPGEIQQMWIDVFNSLIYSATVSSAFQASWATVHTDAEGNVIFELKGPDESNLWNDVTIDYTEVNANVVLQPVGWQGS